MSPDGGQHGCADYWKGVGMNTRARTSAHRRAQLGVLVALTFAAAAASCSRGGTGAANTRPTGDAGGTNTVSVDAGGRNLANVDTRESDMANVDTELARIEASGKLGGVEIEYYVGGGLPPPHYRSDQL